jgi:hypothetical protein
LRDPVKVREIRNFQENLMKTLKRSKQFSQYIRIHSKITISGVNHKLYPQEILTKSSNP